jgi:hypothetical protein
MSVSCFLCETKIKIENNQKNMLNQLLTLTCFEHFNKKKQLYYLCNSCTECDDSFSTIYDFLGFENHDLRNVNLFMSNENIYILKQNVKQVSKQSYKKQKQIERKELLMSTIKKLRIEYNKPICDEYIKFGKTDLKDVLEKLTHVQSQKNNRLYDLLNELQKHNVEYDSRLPAFKKYVENGGNIKKTIERGLLEKTLADNTDYLSLLNNDVDSETAIDLSISKFPNDTDNKIINNYVESKTRIIF